MPDKRSFSEIIANEPDILRRMALINFNMDALKDPEEALLTYNTPDGYYEQWAEAHYKNLIDRTAKRTGVAPDILADKDARTTEQYNEILKTSAQEQIARLEMFVQSNYIAALKHINEYCTAVAEAQGIEDLYKPLTENPDCQEHLTGELLNVPLATALYFFATHEDSDPRGQEGLTAEHTQAIIETFTQLDAFYKENRDTLHTEYELLKAYLDLLNPNPARAQETLERLNALAIVPKRMIAPNHKLVNSLTRATRTPEDVIEIVLDVSRRGAKNRVTATCILSYEGENVKISGRQPFTEYDRNVYNAVVSLYVAGNRVFTSDMAWRTMNGKTEQEQPTPAQKAAVTKSLDKMRFMRAQIDCGDEFKMRRVTMPDGNAVTGAGYDDNLLHLSVKWVRAGKNTIRAYEVLSAPVLYEYSSAVKQVMNVPIALLDVKKLDKQGKPTTHSLEYTERRVIIKGYLLRRIEGMKGKNALQNKHIAFMDYVKDGQTHEGLYSIAGSPELSQPIPSGMTEAEKTKRKNDARYIREDAAAILKYWEVSGYIKGFSDYRDGRTVAGYEIML